MSRPVDGRWGEDAVSPSEHNGANKTGPGPQEPGQLRAVDNRSGVPVSERLTAAFLLLLVSPLLAILTLMVALMIGRPAFYRGKRLGKGKRPFYLIKFRTLPLSIQQRLGAMLFSEQEEPLPILARFLRDSRLDELPQLLNIVRGEMRFFGPRPERPEVYEAAGKGNPDYEVRFLVAPGLFGVSQLVTPHSTPKKLRARLDRRFLAGGVRFGIFFVAITAWALMRRLVAAFVRYFWDTTIRLRLLRGEKEKRTQSRIRPVSGTIEFVDPLTNEALGTGTIIDMNRDFLRARFDAPLPWSFVIPHRGRIALLTDRGKTKRLKTARARVEIERALWRDESGPFEYVIAYQPETTYHRYLIDQYFLGQAILPRP